MESSPLTYLAWMLEAQFSDQTGQAKDTKHSLNTISMIIGWSQSWDNFFATRGLFQISKDCIAGKEAFIS